MIFVSYFTEKTPYERVIQECLMPGLKKFNLEHDIQGVKDRGGWADNTGYKCEFIEEMLKKHNQSICFLDSDAKIVKYPILLFNLPKNIDVAYHHFNWFGFWRGQWENTNNIQLLSGTMVWNPTPNVFKIIQEWKLKVQENINKWEQVVLEEIVNSHSELNIYDLPMDYCCIVKSDESICDKVKNPIILHTQVSRKLKRRQNWA